MQKYLQFEVFMEAVMKSTVLLVVMPCGLVEVYTGNLEKHADPSS
jgi:hypothetical protein